MLYYTHTHSLTHIQTSSSNNNMRFYSDPSSSLLLYHYWKKIVFSESKLTHSPLSMVFGFLYLHLLLCHSFAYFCSFLPKRIIFSSPVQIHTSVFLMCLFVIWIWILVWFALKSHSTIGSKRNHCVTFRFWWKKNSKYNSFI